MGRVILGTLLFLALGACQRPGMLRAGGAVETPIATPRQDSQAEIIAVLDAEKTSELACTDFPEPAARSVAGEAGTPALAGAALTTAAPTRLPGPTPSPGRTAYLKSDPYRVAPTWSEEERLCRCRRLQRARRTSNWITIGALGAMAAYGIAYFDYGDTNWQAKSDGWFERSNKDGGADKTGHATSAHIETAAFSWINRKLGIPRKEAALRGAISAFAVSLTMEVGDGFSDQFGFSWTDIVANGVGCTFGYFHASSPSFARLFDLRWEYFPSQMALDGEISEYTTDIEGSAHLLAINVGALVSDQPSLWDLADIQIGYMARHYKDHDAPTERRPFIGIGLNVGNVLRRIGWGKIAWFFDYYQVPFVSLRWSTDLND